ncbi:type II toxin-antitoxin system Phd/YefM family antitoxin [Aurantimonas sp. A3-2-R12]|uniref:type II toxin-antitoxin system Phd/YefM family antitoxin n=1 Tax=Aurantimonas sp. A3-2-R12 TaxID=3114362 RepID=UPI002E18EBC5|nr:type II toxin-antitoxin system prevent-host-death family antitoxin [Aurantimonas sp. A3-2-R12]
MSHVNFSELRANMASYFDRVEADRTELVVTRQNHEPVVVMALSEWEGMKETLHLLSTPANADHLRSSIRSYDEGRATKRDLIDP